MASIGVLFISVLVLASFPRSLCLAVLQGSSVTLPCGNHLTNNPPDISWCKKLPVSPCKEVSHRIGNNANSVYPPWNTNDTHLTNYSSLTIASVNHTRDNGTFICVSGHTEAEVDLTVIVPPENVSIHGATFPLPENTITTWTCAAKGGIPVPQITWEIGLPKVSLKQEKVLDTVTSSVSFVVSRTMDVIRCKATQFQYSVIREIALDILYKPIASIEVSPAQYSLGSEVTLVCLAEGNPKPDILWMFNGKVLEKKDNNRDHTLGRYRDAVKTKSNEPARGTPELNPGKENGSPLQNLSAHRLGDGSKVRQRRRLLEEVKTAPVAQASKETWNNVSFRDGRKRDLSENSGDINSKSEARIDHIISSMNTSNIGRYTCEARNYLGVAIQSVTLNPKSPLEMLLPYLQPVLIGLVFLLLTGVSIPCIRKRCKGNVKEKPKTAPTPEAIEMAEIPNIHVDAMEINPNQNEQTVEEADGQESAMTQPTMPSLPQIVISVNVHMQGQQSEQIIQEVDDDSGSYLHPVHRPRARGPYESLGATAASTRGPYESPGAATANKLDHPSSLLPHRLCQSSIDLIDKSSRDYPIPGEGPARKGGDRDSDPYESLFRLGQKRYTY